MVLLFLNKKKSFWVITLGLSDIFLFQTYGVGDSLLASIFVWVII